MATEVVTTSLTVGFDKESTEGASGIFSAEIDDRDESEGGGNPKGTSFKPGDTVAIMLFKTSNIVSPFLAQISTHGHLATTTDFNASKEVDEFLVFDNSTTVSLNYPGAVASNFTWLGNSLGSVNIVDYGATLELAVTPTDTYYAGVTWAQYTSSGTAYRLTDTLLGTYDKYEIFCYWAATANL